MNYLFGFDVGGTTIKCGIFDAEGTLLEKTEIPTRKEERGAYILSDIADVFQRGCEKNGIQKSDVLGIGIGVPGPVVDNRVCMRASNLGWSKTDVAATLSELTGIRRVVCLNDANSAALGEIWKGSGKGHHSLLLVTLGTGIGGGIVVNDHVVSGAFGSAGEIGHIYAGGDRLCNCGNVGCVERYSSATGIIYTARELLARKPEVPSMLRDIDEINPKVVFDAVREADPIALEVAKDFGERLGTAIAIICCIVDPEIVVLGGGVSKAGDILFDFIQIPFQSHVFPASRNVTFRLAELGNDAGMYGAIRAVRQSMED